MFGKKKKKDCSFSFIYRVETVGQPDRRDSIGVCAERQNGYDSLQRDQAVCISTNGKRAVCQPFDTYILITIVRYESVPISHIYSRR